MSIATDSKFYRILEVLNSLDIIQEDILDRFSAIKDLLNFARSNYDNMKMRVSMKFFTYAIGTYVLSYNEASVFYAALSVELTLLKSAIKKWGEDVLVEIQQRSEKWKKKYPRGLTFYWLIHQAGILNKNNGDVAVAENIRLMRDSYVHYQNQLMFSSLEYLFEPEDYEKIPSEHIAEVNELSQMLKTAMQSIYPTPTKLVNPKCFQFMKKQRDKVEKRMLDKYKSKVVAASTEETVKWVNKELSVEFLDMLIWCKRILENPAYYL